MNGQLPDPGRYLRKLVSQLSIGYPTVGLMTAVPMTQLVTSRVSAGELWVECFATVGVTNAVRAGEWPLQPARRKETHSMRVGTINLILITNGSLSTSAMVGAVQVATETKTGVLRDHTIPSWKGKDLATGTGTDAVVIACRLRGKGPLHTYSGTHTMMGALVGRAVSNCVSHGLAKQERDRRCTDEGSSDWDSRYWLRCREEFDHGRNLSPASSDRCPVAPFKAQNMSLNSFVTPDGHEIGRAQALQAKACGIPPHVDMNPILLKPESDNCSQVVVHGKVLGKREASAYFDGRKGLWSVIEESYARLASQYEVLVIEGAGSAAEVNLRKDDLVNWPVAKLADAQVVLVADIDRGGVFAQVLGTLDLLLPDERARVCGVIINKFRGDAKLFADGVKFLEARSGLPVLGVVPFLRDLMLDQEDSLDLGRNRQTSFVSDRVNIAVILLPHMSNFTDFNILASETDVALKYVTSPSMLAEADVVIIPGSKNTLADLSYLKEKEYVPVLDNHLHSRRELIGICGGYQMLGRTISDPCAVEQGGLSDGLGYLNTETELKQAKCTTQVEASMENIFMGGQLLVRGYQIHMGVTRRANDDFPVLEFAGPIQH